MTARDEANEIQDEDSVVEDHDTIAAQDIPVSVFVIDDDRDMRQSLERIFHDAQLDVKTFEKPADFLDFYTRDMLGCLVLDLQLPGMDGLELQETLTERGCELPFVMITGYGDVPNVVEAFRRGAIDFIEKPFRSTQLLNCVEQALARVVQAESKRRTRLGIQKLRECLTPRESELMDLLIAGVSTKNAATEMGISPKTAHIHRARVLEKMEAETVAQLVKRMHHTVLKD